MQYRNFNLKQFAFANYRQLVKTEWHSRNLSFKDISLELLTEKD